MATITTDWAESIDKFRQNNVSEMCFNIQCIARSLYRSIHISMIAFYCGGAESEIFSLKYALFNFGVERKKSFIKYFHRNAYLNSPYAHHSFYVPHDTHNV